MARRHLLALLMLISGVASAQTPPADEDGFTQPLRNLEFNPGLDQREFERATFDALKKQTSPRAVASRRGKKVADVLSRRGGNAVAER